MRFQCAKCGQVYYANKGHDCKPQKSPQAKQPAPSKPANTPTIKQPKAVKPKAPASKALPHKDEGTNSQSSKGTNAKSANTLKVAAYREAHRADYNEYMRKLMRERRASQK